MENFESSDRIFITGVHKGIGHALAKHYLERGIRVVGLSREYPEDLRTYEKFEFFSLDLGDRASAQRFIAENLPLLTREPLTTVYFNAGISGNIPVRAEDCSLEDLERVCMVNTYSIKLCLDGLIKLGALPGKCVFSASIAGQRFRAGMLPYSVSKAALTALAGVYAQENPSTFFIVIGLCTMDTDLSRRMLAQANISQFAELNALATRCEQVGYMTPPEIRAEQLACIVRNTDRFNIKSGIFSEIRTLLNDQNKASVKN
ncbi:SDR family oxidoreductase [Acetobacter senegalensis]|uniref:SDR family NAD(P)-dependent oxidoreductase n=1 Tax=Acetobacter senegalensis TaxID=446692 RepID=UPI00209F7678|nr:SDR family oxidoreductase [Acetobacter senegalensis]